MEFNYICKQVINTVTSPLILHVQLEVYEFKLTLGRRIAILRWSKWAVLVGKWTTFQQFYYGKNWQIFCTMQETCYKNMYKIIERSWFMYLVFRKRMCSYYLGVLKSTSTYNYILFCILLLYQDDKMLKILCHKFL